MASGEWMTDSTGERVQPEPEKRRKSFGWPAVVIWLLAFLLLGWSLRQVPLGGVWQTLRGLHAWQLALLVSANMLIFLMMSERWRRVLAGLAQPVRGLSLMGYRLASFGVSYFTPGPQFGGEPLQVLFLTRRKRINTPAAVSSVFLDRLLELLANFTFLMVGLVVIVTSNLFKGLLQVWIWPAAALVLALPLLHLAALWRGRMPLTWLLSRLGRRVEKARVLAERAERQIAVLCVTRPRVLAVGIGLSALVWLSLLGEYLLMVRFLDIPFDLVQAVIALTLAQLAFLVPLPGGLGALEASQVLAMQLFGFSPALGLSLSLLIRARDVLFGGAGLFLAAWLARG